MPPLVALLFVFSVRALNCLNRQQIFSHRKLDIFKQLARLSPQIL
jgi:hypothetical protein